MNILYVFSDGLSEYNSSNFRVCYLADALRREGHNVNIINVKQWIRQSPECKFLAARADIIHVQRVLINDTHEHIKFWTSLGKAVVPDWDDSYDRILPSNAAADFWLHGKVEVEDEDGNTRNVTLKQHPVEQFRAGLALCTAGITPSKVLSEDWKKYAPTYVVKNFLDKEHYVAARRDIENEHVFIGWGGSLSHTQSWELSGIEEAIQRVVKERDNVRLFIVGDTRVIDQIPVRRDRVIFHPYVSWRNWPTLVNKFDIGLAPLAGEYDDRRSSLKVSEYLLMGIPFVATSSPVYEDFVDVSSGKFVDPGHDSEHYDDRSEQWYQNTIDILDNLGDYREKSKENIRIGESYDAYENIGDVIEVYETIIDIAKTNANKK